jgi:very-short-patch-repair endonuclease
VTVDVQLTNLAQRFAKNAAIEIEYNSERAITNYLTAFCESPIEAALLASLVLLSSLVSWAYSGTPFIEIVRQRDIDKRRHRGITIVPQFQWKDYRIDFAFFSIPNSAGPDLFVECDGHAFHERTPEQAERDRSRDRAIQQAGIPILRFTGREIYRDTFGCASEVINFLASRPSEKSDG